MTSTDPQTATLEFVQAQLRLAQEQVAKWQKVMNAIKDALPTNGQKAASVSSSSPGNGAATPRGSQSRREIVFQYFRGHPTLAASLGDLHPEMVPLGITSKDSLREVLYGLRDEGLLVAVRGDTNWAPTTYHLAPPGYKPPPKGGDS